MRSDWYNLAGGHVQSHEVHFCLAELRIHCDGSGTGVACAIVRVPRVVRVHAIRCASGQRIRPPDAVPLLMVRVSKPKLPVPCVAIWTKA